MNLTGLQVLSVHANMHIACRETSRSRAPSTPRTAASTAYNRSPGTWFSASSSTVDSMMRVQTPSRYLPVTAKASTPNSDNSLPGFEFFEESNGPASPHDDEKYAGWLNMYSLNALNYTYSASATVGVTVGRPSVSGDPNADASCCRVSGLNKLRHLGHAM